ncbi:hypothetical protein [Halorussus amylolyticus]|uniref:hypothetical protein n=1 Tax=Halorussus amylolyticus TaxID=1126242 RepID=UPI001048E153|nr:hypothetical protein [Halorussus amylolyticus]
MRGNEPRFWAGVATLAIAGALLFAPLVASMPYLDAILAVSVVAAYAGAVLVGLSTEGRPV